MLSQKCRRTIGLRASPTDATELVPTLRSVPAINQPSNPDGAGYTIGLDLSSKEQETQATDEPTSPMTTGPERPIKTKPSRYKNQSKPHTSRRSRRFTRSRGKKEPEAWWTDETAATDHPIVRRGELNDMLSRGPNASAPALTTSVGDFGLTATLGPGSHGSPNSSGLAKSSNAPPARYKRRR
ncbi:hypothetical protein IAT40_001802 [Kwoniella sp. CBS 6097]